MSGTDRLKRLRDLVNRLEQLPASAERDRVLGEVRARAVDLDTGETPRAMLEEDPFSPMVGPIERRRTSAGPRPPRAPRRVPQAEPAKAPREALPREAAEALPGRDPADRVHLLWDDDWPPTEDSPAPEADTPPFRPWTLGLRG